jgi:hypothetical protein
MLLTIFLFDVIDFDLILLDLKYFGFEGGQEQSHFFVFVSAQELRMHLVITLIANFLENLDVTVFII